VSAQTLVLPSHGRPFVGLHERVAQLTAHHDERLQRVLQACRAAPCTAAQMLPLLFRPGLDAHQTSFALGEALAHLHLLWHAGSLKRHCGDDGVWRFSAV
jgi:hypothetical protein